LQSDDEEIQHAVSSGMDGATIKVDGSANQPNQPTNQPNSQSHQARYRMPVWKDLES
jgi:hypothetical protein